jgi:N-acetylglucosamine kinase-like BadF-type ATPase
LRGLDGRERKTAIGKMLVGKFKLRTLENIVHEVHEKPMTVEEIAAVSRLVALAASRGDRVARSIFAHEGRVLASLASVTAERLGMTRSKPDIYCTGGVFRAGVAILKPFRRELRKNIPRFIIRRPRFEPVVGAFILALREERVATRGRTLANLQTSYESHRMGIV